MAQIQEVIKKEKVKLLWIPGNEILADILTKKGVSADSILEVFRTGRLARRNEKETGIRLRVWTDQRIRDEQRQSVRGKQRIEKVVSVSMCFTR